MSKGIAIQTILYLLIGVLVVGIVVYLVYTYVIGAPIGEQQCRTQAITWCTSCKNVAWVGGPTATSDLVTCAGKYFSNWPASGACADATTFCAVFIPV